MKNIHKICYCLGGGGGGGNLKLRGVKFPPLKAMKKRLYVTTIASFLVGIKWGWVSAIHYFC